MTSREPPLDPQAVRAIFQRHRTVRQYQTQPDGSPLRLPAEHLEVVLYAAQRAPTDATAQLYSLIHLGDQELRREVAELTQNAHIATASEAFVVCADRHRLDQLLRLSGYTPAHWPSLALHFGLGDAVLAGQNLLLAAELLGYQGCWIGGVINALPELIERLALPAGVLPFAALTIGLPAEDAPYRPRVPRPLVVHQDRYQVADEVALWEAVQIMNPIAERPGKPGDWAKLLNLYFGQGGRMEQREAIMRQALLKQELSDQK